jgi:hypothetical protein
MRDERLATAALVLAASLTLNAGGLLLLFVGGVGVLFAIVLLGFGVTGVVQSIAIALGRRRPSDRAPERPGEDDR